MGMQYWVLVVTLVIVVPLVVGDIVVKGRDKRAGNPQARR